MYQLVMLRPSSATRAWPSRWRSTPIPTTKPSSTRSPGYMASSTRPELGSVATWTSYRQAKMILRIWVLPGQRRARQDSNPRPAA